MVLSQGERLQVPQNKSIFKGNMKLQLVFIVNKWDINSNIAFVDDKFKKIINAIIKDEVMNVHQLIIPTTTNVLPNVHV
jgi:hypothetical protein